MFWNIFYLKLKGISFFRQILMAAKRLKHGHFQWIASDGWGKQQRLVVGLKDVAQGAITVELTSKVKKLYKFI